MLSWKEHRLEVTNRGLNLALCTLGQVDKLNFPLLQNTQSLLCWFCIWSVLVMKWEGATEGSVWDRQAISSPFLKPLKSVFTELSAASKTCSCSNLGMSRTQTCQAPLFQKTFPSLPFTFSRSGCWVSFSWINGRLDVATGGLILCKCCCQPVFHSSWHWSKPSFLTTLLIIHYSGHRAGCYWRASWENVLLRNPLTRNELFVLLMSLWDPRVHQ